MTLCKKCTLYFKMQHFKETKNSWLFSNHCLCHLVPCISIKLGTVVWWPFLVIKNKSSRIYFNIFGDFVIKSLKSRETQKVVSFPCRSRKNLWIYSWYSLSNSRLTTRPKAFHSYSFLERSRNEAFYPVRVNFN